MFIYNEKMAKDRPPNKANELTKNDVAPLVLVGAEVDDVLVEPPVVKTLVAVVRVVDRLLGGAKLVVRVDEGGVVTVVLSVVAGAVVEADDDSDVDSNVAEVVVEAVDPAEVVEVVPITPPVISNGLPHWKMEVLLSRLI